MIRITATETQCEANIIREIRYHSNNSLVE